MAERSGVTQGATPGEWYRTGPSPFGWTDGDRGQVTVTLSGPSGGGRASDMAERVLRDLNAAPALAEALASCVEWLDAIRVDSEAARVMLDACPSGFFLNKARAALASAKGGAA